MKRRVFFRTNNRMVQVAIGLGGASAAGAFALILKHTDWQARWQILSLFGLWPACSVIFWTAFDIANPFLIRWLASDDLYREVESFAKDLAGKLLNNEPVDFLPQDDLIKQEAVKCIQEYLLDQPY